jgi:hypothetical protein
MRLMPRALVSTTSRVDAAALSLPPCPLPHYLLVTFQKSRVGDMTGRVVPPERCSYDNSVDTHRVERPPISGKRS